jgi:hypothetical protein
MHRKALWVLGVLPALALYSSEGGASPQYYPLTCRTSASLKLAVFNLKDGGNLYNRKTKWVIHFRKGTEAAGPNLENVKPGECTWLTRPMYGDEPSCIAHEFSDTRVWAVTLPVQMWLKPDNTVSGTNLTAYEAGEWWLFKAFNQSEGKLFRAPAYNPQTGGCFVVQEASDFPAWKML